jgi:hypothetical protein
MSTTPEARFSAKIRAALPDCYVTRIESRTTLGIPDMLIGLKHIGKFAMVELKVVTSGLKVRLRPHQVAFLVSHASIGCPVFVLVLHKKEGERVGMVHLYHGRDADKLVTEGLRMEPLLSFPSNKIEWNKLVYTLGAVG